MSKNNYFVLFVLVVTLIILPAYPSVDGIAQIVTDTTKVISPTDVNAIIEASRRDSLAFIKAADENTKYQDILIVKFKKQKKEIEALKKENLLLRASLNKSNLVTDSTKKVIKKKSFLGRLFRKH